ncbi:hypothetical protein NE237_028111 [Protea cynaroides]|uniref:Uncharacterized protein n=1 Tax=Protea cynaroides TaxID=273540 RepID=A0A9Q0GT62_9MAGN|nr:hypothetical protein NE237_028111 [Protea cynaroides]
MSSLLIPAPNVPSLEVNIPISTSSSALKLPTRTPITLDLSISTLTAPDLPVMTLTALGPSLSAQASPMRTIKEKITAIWDAHPRGSPYWSKWTELLEGICFLKDSGLFASKDDGELMEQVSLGIINLVDPILDCMGQFDTFRKNICSFQLARDEAMKSYESQMVEVTSMSIELEMTKEHTIASLEEAKSALEKAKEEFDMKANKLVKREADSERSSLKSKRLKRVMS